jgi:hypothetical protein
MGIGISSFVFFLKKRIRQNNKSPGRKEEGIPLAIFLPAVGIILRWVEVRPHAHGVDVLVFFVPPTIDDFDQTRIAVEAFQLGVWDLSGLVFELIGGQESGGGFGWLFGQGAVGGWDQVRGRCGCGLGGEWEEDAVVAGAFVEYERVEVEVLLNTPLAFFFRI